MLPYYYQTFSCVYVPDKYDTRVISVQGGSYWSGQEKKELEAIVAAITAPKALIVFFAGNVNECVLIAQRNEPKAVLIMTKEDRREAQKKVQQLFVLLQIARKNVFAILGRALAKSR